MPTRTRSLPSGSFPFRCRLKPNNVIDGALRAQANANIRQQPIIQRCGRPFRLPHLLPTGPMGIHGLRSRANDHPRKRVPRTLGMDNLGKSRRPKAFFRSHRTVYDLKECRNSQKILTAPRSGSYTPARLRIPPGSARPEGLRPSAQRRPRAGTASSRNLPLRLDRQR